MSPSDEARTGGALTPDEIRALTERMDERLEALQARAEPELVALVAELLDGLQRVHAEGLRRLVELLAEESERFRRALDDPVISNLFVLYDLVFLDEARRAREALEQVQPLARSHGGEIRLLGVEEGVVRVRLLGACHGCPSSSATLRQGVEEALARRLPGFVRLEVEGETPAAPGGAERRAAPPPGGSGHQAGGVSATGERSHVDPERLVRLERRLEEARASGDGTPARPDARGEDAGSRPLRFSGADAVPERGLVGRIIERRPLLVVSLGDGALRAYRNACPDSILPLHLGTLEDGVVRCPWHGCRFDAATGQRVEGRGGALEPLPIEIRDGALWVEAP